MTTIFIIIGVIVFVVVFVLIFLVGTIINIVDMIQKAVHKRSKNSGSVSPFENRTSLLSKPFYAKNAIYNKTIYFICGIIFVLFGAGASFSKIYTLGLVLVVLGICGIVFSIIIEFCGAMQTGNCPYCNMKIKMKRSEKQFRCPLCNKSIVKTKTTMYNAEPIFEHTIAPANANERIIELITKDFEKNGWRKWDEATHRKPGQLDRLRRGTGENNNIILVQYNPLKGIAKVKGSSGRYYLTSGERCSCPDYRKRLLPCKHMYKLATLLPNYQDKLQPDDSFKSSISHDNVFGGLCFSIVGRNQAPVKEFITAHGGVYGKYYMSEESAVVLASDMMTNKRAEATTNDYEILTFEDLQNLFDIFVD